MRITFEFVIIDLISNNFRSHFLLKIAAKTREIEYIACV